MCGRQFLMVAQNYGSYEIFSPERYPEVAKQIVGHYVRQESLEMYLGKFKSENVELSRKVGAPVFAIDRVTGGYYNYVNRRENDQEVFISRDIPVLSSVGLPTHIPAEQLYQDIAYFIVNKMQTCPDTQPVGNPGQTDKEKIASHGFDMKQSFRHRR